MLASNNPPSASQDKRREEEDEEISQTSVFLSPSPLPSSCFAPRLGRHGRCCVSRAAAAATHPPRQRRVVLRAPPAQTATAVRRTVGDKKHCQRLRRKPDSHTMGLQSNTHINFYKANVVQKLDNSGIITSAERLHHETEKEGDERSDGLTAACKRMCHGARKQAGTVWRRPAVSIGGGETFCGWPIGRCDDDSATRRRQVFLSFFRPPPPPPPADCCRTGTFAW